MPRLITVAIVAILAALIPSVAIAQDSGVQEIDASVTPSKLDKKKFKPVTLFIDIITNNNDEAGQNPDQPPSADRVRVDFTSNLKFDTSAKPGCNGNSGSLENTTTDQAIAVCGSKSIVSVAGDGKTEATVLVDPNPAVPGSTPLTIDVVVTAFNGASKNEIILHARAEAARNTSILAGRLSKGPQGYGQTLDVAVPDLLAGALADFRVTVKAGKYVQGNCRDKTPSFQARTEYENHAPTVATDTESCKQKKSKGKK